MKKTFYKSTRLTFKRDIIESLDDDDIYVNENAEGVFEISKRDFYRYFGNVATSKSYRKTGVYNYQTTPQKAYQFFTGEKLGSVTTENHKGQMTHIQPSKYDLVGQEIRDKIREIGRIWKNSSNNRRISEDILKNWKKLINTWAEDESLPLIIRKETQKKGQSENHPSGREIVYADNSLSLWVYYNALNKTTFSISQIKELLKNDEIPVMFISTKELKENAKYKKSLGTDLKGWKLCHIDSVGFNTRRKVCELDIDEIKEHFKKYADPNNMFLLPEEIGSLGEIKEFIEEQK